VAVLWYDIVDDTNDWKHGEPTIEPMLITTVGILYNTKKDHIILVRDLYSDEGGFVTGGRLAIPKGVIKEIIMLEAKKK
jgi:hypothetical protein